MGGTGVLMAGFNQTYLPIRTIQPDFGGVDGWVGGSAPPSDWQKYNDWPPANADVKPNDFAPNTSVFTCTSTGAGNFPAAYWQTHYITNGGTPHRFSASLRAGQDNIFAGYADGDPVLYCWMGITYGSRFATDAALTAMPQLLVGILSREHVAGYLSVFVNQSGNSQEYRIATSATLYADLYYRMGAEVIGKQVHIYFDPNGASDPSTLPGDSDIEYFTTIPMGSTFDGPPAFVMCAPAGHLSGGAANLGCAVHNLILEELVGPAGAGLPPGAGGTAFPISSGGPPPWGTGPGGPLPGGQMSSYDFSSYRRYKAVRQAGFMLNNLQVGP